MTTTRFRHYLIIAGAGLLLSACAGEPHCASPTIACAGLVTDLGGVDDHGPNQGTWEGLQAGLADGTLNHAAFIETMDPRDYTSNMRYFAQRDYDLIITIGPGAQGETAEVASEYPAVRFLALDQDHTEAPVNLFGVTFPEDQMGFLAGAAAALTSHTGVVAAVCESASLDAMRRYCEGFRRGAQHVDAGVRTVVIFRDEGSSTMLFRDSDWGQEAARDAIQAGADVVFGVGGGTGQAALRAAAESGTYAIGAEQDQWYALPEARPLLLTSVYADAKAAVVKWSPLLLSGTAPAGKAVAPIAIAPFHDLALTIPGERRAQLNAILSALQNGALETGVPAHTPE